jgi:hypothetical protein
MSQVETREAKGLPACEGHLRTLLLARNASGVRQLAEEFAVPPDELAAFTRTMLEEELRPGIPDRLGPRFDIHTSAYSTLEEWAAGFLKSL